ncbi:hypothetical protein [Streptomyces sp. NPDC002187]|uniref:hypothetical protein n=1 Tax=Streptomyces sp. NPDC002187 TaxID=3364637 RepID=UPI00368F095A
MNLYVGIPVAVLAVLVAVSGVAAVRTGWMLPNQRKHVIRPRLFGYAQLLLSVCLGTQLAGALFLSGSDMRSAVTYGGTALMLGVPALVWASQRPGRADSPAS